MSERRRLLTTQEVAKILRTTPGYLNNLRMRGEGPPYYKFSRRVLFDGDELDEWIRKHKVRTVD